MSCHGMAWHVDSSIAGVKHFCRCTQLQIAGLSVRKELVIWEASHGIHGMQENERERTCRLSHGMAWQGMAYWFFYRRSSPNLSMDLKLKVYIMLSTIHAPNKVRMTRTCLCLLGLWCPRGSARCLINEYATRRVPAIQKQKTDCHVLYERTTNELIAWAAA
jgi:hypothetical protein